MRSRRALHGLIVLACGGLAAIEGCSLVTGYDGFTGVAPVATCGARVPANTAKGGGATDKGPLVGAAQAFRFLDVDGSGPPLGLDLDENCTTRACEPKSGPARALGVDNVLGKFIGQLNAQADISTAAIRNGTLGLLIQVKGWNGTDSDDDVAVTLFNVAGLNGSTDGGAAPANDGGDIYVPREDDLLTSPVAKPVYTSIQAYVAKKQLVARFEQVRLRIVSPSFAMPTEQKVVAVELVLVDAAIVGTLVLAKGGIQMLDAQVVGRVRDNDMLQVISRLGLCASASSYSGLKSDLCGRIDLTDSKNTDGKRRPCTSGSIAIGLPFAPAQIATVTAPAPLGPYACPDDPPDSCGGR